MIDAERLSQLFTAHAGPMALYARQFGVSDADELVQEAFVRLLGQPVEPPAVQGWLLTTLRRLAIDRQRNWLRRRRRERSRDTTPWFVPLADDAIDARHATALLQQLPQRQREVLVLRLWHDRTLTQIADLLGVAISTVHADLQTGLATLRLKLEVSDERRQLR